MSNEAGGDTEYIKLKVVGQDSNEVHFRVKMTTQVLVNVFFTCTSYIVQYFMLFCYAHLFG